jgi:hypothetical protein
MLTKRFDDPLHRTPKVHQTLMHFDDFDGVAPPSESNRGGEAALHIYDLYPAGRSCAVVAHRGNSDDRLRADSSGIQHERPVLVGIAELLKDRQRVEVTPVAPMVRLRLLDQCKRSLVRDPFKLSLETSQVLCICWAESHYRELRLFS